MRSLLQSSQPAVRALHTRRGALAVEKPARRDWVVTSAIVVPWAVSVIVITKVLGHCTERAVGRKVCVRLRLSEMRSLLVGSRYDVQPLLRANCDPTITWAQVSIMQLHTKHG